MTDREALHRNVIVDPTDNFARLIIADHFEENGESERAEFIRVQIELAELGTCNGYRGRPWPRTGGRCALSGCQFCRLADRALKLKRLANYGCNWLPFREVRTPLNGSSTKVEKVPLIEPHTATWSRGFVSAVRCRLADWVGVCPQYGITDHTTDACPYCSGTGRVHRPFGPRIVAEQPVERVEITDQQPYPGELRSDFERHAWFHPDVPPSDGSRQSLPVKIFRMIDGYRNNGSSPSRVKWFDGIPAARAALSLACLNWARREAGLPPLPAPSRDLGRVAV